MSHPSVKASVLVWNLSTNDGIVRATLLGEAWKRLGLGLTFGEGLYQAIPSHSKVISVPGSTYPKFWKSVKALLSQLDGEIIYYAVKPQPSSYGGRSKYGLARYRLLRVPKAPRPYKWVEDVLIALEQLKPPDLKLALVGGSPYNE